MRICIELSTGKLIEAQSGDDAPHGTLVTNAVAAGHAAGDVEEKVVSNAEFKAILLASKSIPELRAAAISKIDTDAERARQAWATGGDLQSLVYEGKRREAAAYAVDGTPDPSTYPLLAAEIGLTADSLAGVAAIVSAKSAGWTQAAAAIERIRVGAKMGIDAATDQAGIDAVIAGMNPWPVP